jgi:hypothetical protein
MEHDLGSDLVEETQDRFSTPEVKVAAARYENLTSAALLQLATYGTS